MGMRTLFVTGGAGFIGGNFVHFALSRAGVRVVNLDALTYAGHLETLAQAQNNPAHVFVHGDIGDRDLVRRLFAEHRPSAVVNFAAESHVDRSIDGPAAFIQTNVLGTFNLLDCAREYWLQLTEPERRAFWAGLFSALAKHESTWNPEAKGGGGRWIGLMQIAPDTARAYDCDLPEGAGLTDGEANLACAVKIAAAQVGRDGAIVSDGSGDWRGIARDWAPMRVEAKREDVADWTSAQDYCRG